ncbi:pyrroline-5-carboxylate reductase [Anaerorhabdus sp.]|uniref:pyrroline-5-carboxylate reductase n=1 Tax=Anaerorhabdus sp. TaxID=1872524 RepID=UPI002FCBB5A7
MNKKICFIGCGNMAEAIISGMIKSGVDPLNIIASRRDESKLEELHNHYGIDVTSSNTSACAIADIVLLCVKPNMIEKICKELKNNILPQATIVSIAAGVTIKQLQEWLGKDRNIVRAMPNTPAMVQAGMTSLSLSEGMKLETQYDNVQDIKMLFECCGQCEIVDEYLIDAVIGVSGSSPAYVYMMIEAMADGAVKEGMTRKQAYLFAAQAVYGSAKMVLESNLHPGELKDRVASPGGTTIDAIASLEKNGFRNAVIEAVVTAAEKNKKM